MANPASLNPPWKPGQSGNPKGKPKGALSTKTILKKYLAVQSGSKHPLTGEPMNCLEHILIKAMEGAMKGNLKAAKEIIDRYEGKPNQKIDLTERKPDDLESMSTTELKEMGNDVLKKLKDKIDSGDQESKGD